MEKEYSKKTSIVSSALILTLSTIIVKVIGLVYKIPLSYLLTDEGMSYFNSAYTVYTFFFIICTAGVPKAISILISDVKVRASLNEENKIYKTALISFSIIGVLSSTILFVFSPYIAKYVGNSGIIPSLITISPSLAFVAASGVIRGYFNGRMDMLPIALSEIISGVFKLVFGILFAIIASKLEADLITISSATILGTSLGSIASCVYLICYKNRHYKNKENVLLHKCIFSFSILKKIFIIVIPLMAASAVGSMSNIIDLFVINKRLREIGYSELQANTIFGNYTTNVIPMLNLVSALIAPFSAVLLPIISRERDNAHEVRKNLETTFVKGKVCIFTIS